MSGALHTGAGAGADSLNHSHDGINNAPGIAEMPVGHTNSTSAGNNNTTTDESFARHIPKVLTTTSARKTKRALKNGKDLRKAPQAPKRFKSSYICFFMAKQPLIKNELGADSNVTAISKRSAEMWKNLPAEERAHWDEVAQKDKERYLQEKANYTGPWQVPYKRQKKNPTAPKRPMSAFLFFSIGQRSKMKKENPQLKNTEISRILGEMWRNLPQEERDPHVQRERTEREKYKIATAEWKKEQESKEAAQRAAQEQMGQNPGVLYDPAAYGGMQPGSYPPTGPAQFMYPYPPYPPPGHFEMLPHVKTPVVLGPNGVPYAPAAVPPPATGTSAPAPTAAAAQFEAAAPSGYDEEGEEGKDGYNYDSDTEDPSELVG